MNKNEIIDGYDLAFDPGDPLNGSLYVGMPLATEQRDATTDMINALRIDGLWSDVAHKHIPPEHRAAYKEQLEFVAAVRYTTGDSQLVVARFDHEKFPSDPARFDAWLTVFDGRLSRLE